MLILAHFDLVSTDAQTFFSSSLPPNVPVFESLSLHLHIEVPPPPGSLPLCIFPLMNVLLCSFTLLETSLLSCRLSSSATFSCQLCPGFAVISRNVFYSSSLGCIPLTLYFVHPSYPLTVNCGYPPLT